VTLENARHRYQRCLDCAYVLLVVQGAWLVAEPVSSDTCTAVFVGNDGSRVLRSWLVLLQAVTLMLDRARTADNAFRAIALILCNALLFLAQRLFRPDWRQGLPYPERLSLAAVLVSVALAVWFERAARNARADSRATA
jgi:hypothetical protein